MEVDPDALKSIHSGLTLIQSYMGSGQHGRDCNGDDDGPCDCGYVDPREVVEALLTQLDEIIRPQSTFFCVAGCGYPVAEADSLCGECSCEDDSSIW